MNKENIENLKKLCSNIRFEANIARLSSDAHKEEFDKTKRAENFWEHCRLIGKALTYEDIAQCIEKNALEGQ